MALKDDLTVLFADPASGIEAPGLDLEAAPNGKVAGFIISRTFAGKSQIERQNMIWDYLDNRLDRERMLHIVSLVTVTPDEAKED